MLRSCHIVQETKQAEDESPAGLDRDSNEPAAGNAASPPSSVHPVGKLRSKVNPVAQHCPYTSWLMRALPARCLETCSHARFMPKDKACGNGHVGAALFNATALLSCCCSQPAAKIIRQSQCVGEPHRRQQGAFHEPLLCMQGGAEAKEADAQSARRVSAHSMQRTIAFRTSRRLQGAGLTSIAEEPQGQEQARKGQQAQPAAQCASCDVTSAKRTVVVCQGPCQKQYHLQCAKPKPRPGQHASWACAACKAGVLTR